MQLTGEELYRGLSLYMTHLGLFCTPSVRSNSRGDYKIELYFDQVAEATVDKLKSLGIYEYHEENWIKLDSEKVFSMISKSYVSDGTGVQFFLLEEEPENTYIFLSDSDTSINVKSKSFLGAYARMLVNQKED